MGKTDFQLQPGDECFVMHLLNYFYFSTTLILIGIQTQLKNWKTEFRLLRTNGYVFVYSEIRWHVYLTKNLELWTGYPWLKDSINALIQLFLSTLNVQSFKLYNNEYMIVSTQTKNTEMFAFIAFLVFRLLSHKILFINRKDNRNC